MYLQYNMFCKVFFVKCPVHYQSNMFSTVFYVECPGHGGIKCTVYTMVYTAYSVDNAVCSVQC